MDGRWRKEGYNKKIQKIKLIAVGIYSYLIIPQRIKFKLSWDGEMRETKGVGGG